MTNAIRAMLGLVVLLIVPACKLEPVVVPLPGFFSLISPANGAIGVSATPTFTWEDSFSTETPTYTIQVSTDPGFSTFVFNQSGLTTTSFPAPSALTAGTVYFWLVEAVRSTGTVTATGAPWSFTTVSPTPGPFTMIAPGNASTGVSVTPTFSWNTSAGAATYTLQVTLATDPGFASPVVNQTGLTSTSSAPASPLSASTAYIWRVIAVSTNSTTATGAPFGFTTGTLNTVTLVSPANTSTAVSKTPTYSWSFSGATPASYTLQVSTDPAFGSFTINQSGITSTSTTPAGTLAATTTFSWRVQSFDGSSALLATSPVFTFTTGP